MSVESTGCPKKGGISECYSVCFTAHLIWNLENSFIQFNQFENWDPYVRSKYNTIYEWYQGAVKYNSYYWIRLFITFNFTVVNTQVILSIFQLHAYIFYNSLHFQSYIKLSCNHGLSFTQFIHTTCAPLEDNWDH